MMRTRLNHSLIAILLIAAQFPINGYALPNQVQPGSLAITGCPGGSAPPCFKPYSNTNPLPTTGTSTSAPTTGTGAYTAVTVGVASAQALAAATATVFLDIVNVSNTATICCKLGGAATITGTQCDAGEIPLPPNWHRSWEGTFIPTDAVNCIASAASTQATIGVK